MNEFYKGLYTALVTPFKEDRTIDYQRLERLLWIQLAAEVDGLVVLGTTSEYPTLSPLESSELIKFVLSHCASKCQVIVGTGDNSTASSIAKTQRAADLGADGIMLVSPYYSKPSQVGLLKHFQLIAQSVQLPIILYNVPGRTAVNIELATLKELAQTANIVALKEASGNINIAMNSIAELPPDFSVLSGDDQHAFSIMQLGGKGLISVFSNYQPQIMKELVLALQSANVNRARTLLYSWLPLIKEMFAVASNPIGVKALMSFAGLIEPHLRLPMHELARDELVRLRHLWNKTQV